MESKVHRNPFDVRIRESFADTLERYAPHFSSNCTRSYGHNGDDCPLSNSDQTHPDGLYTWTPFLNDCSVALSDTHLISRGSFKSVVFNISNRFAPREYLVDPVQLEKAVGLLCSKFDKVGPIPPYLGEIVITGTGAPGAGYECCRNKGEASFAHNDEVSEYVRNPWGNPKVLWKYMHKGRETLPAQKLREDKTRAIVFSPFHFYLLELRYISQLDSQLKDGRFNWIAYGSSPTRGYLDFIAKRFSKFPYILKGDCTKWDASLRSAHFDILLRIRKRLSPKSYHHYLEFIYDELKNKSIVLPDGAIFDGDNAQPSGRGGTTSDNCLMHSIIIIYGCIERLAALGKPQTWAEIDKMFDISLYSDDHVAATNDAVFASFEHRADLYRRFGFVLKPEDDQVGEDITEFVFLGGKFHRCKITGRFGYAYADSSLVPCLHQTTDRMETWQIAQTIRSYCEITCFQKKPFNKLTFVYAQLRERYPFLPELPTRAFFISQQFSLE